MCKYLFEIPSLQIDTCVAYIMYERESLEIFIFFIHMIYINYAYMRYKNNIIYSILYIYIYITSNISFVFDNIKKCLE